MEITWHISPQVYKDATQSAILAFFSTNPQVNQKERSHGRLGKCKK